MRTTDLVSVVIPTHNRAALLGRALLSALVQTHRELEVVVVDDASTDATAEVVESFSDARVRLITREINGGQCRARNDGIAAARGQIVAFLDSDDEWAPSKLARQLEAFSRSPRPVAVYTGLFTDFGGRRRRGVARVEGPAAFESLLALPGPLTTSGIAVDRELAGAELHFDEALPAMEEADLLIRLARKHPIARVPEPLYTRFMHSGKRVSSPARFAQARQMILDKYAADFGCLPSLAAASYLRLAQTQLKAGDRSGARRSLLRARGFAPQSARLRLLGAAARLGESPALLALRCYALAGALKAGAPGWHAGAGT